MTDSPFSPAFSRPPFLETIGVGEVLRRLEEGLGAREPFLLLTGESGTGKTTLAHEAIARWESRVAAAFLAYPALTGAELLEEIVLRFGGEPPDGASRPKLIACLERALGDVAARNRVAIIVVDDAHKLPSEALEELRLLANTAQSARQPLEVLLIGLPALDVLIEDPALAALRERVSVRARLEPLTAGETRRYLRHRVTATGDDRSNLFPRKTCQEIAALTGGVPRRINTLAAEALRLARAAGEPVVQPDHLRAAVASLQGTPTARAVEDPDDVAVLELPAAAASPPPSAPATTLTPAPTPPPEKVAAPAPVPSPAPAKVVAPAPVPTPAPPPAKPASPAPLRAASPVVPAPRKAEPAPARPHVEGFEDIDEPPPPPTNHDPGEWVARFVGDRGPVRIGSQAAASAQWSEERPEAAGGESESPPARSRGGRGRPGRPRSRHRRGAGAGSLITTVALAAVAVTAVVLVIRAGHMMPGASRGGALVASAEAPEDGGSNAGTTGPRATASTREAGSAPNADHSMPSPTGRYTIDVGGYSDLQTALHERDRIQQLTGIQGWVVTREEGSESHRVVLGIFRSQERARSAARMLVSTRTLPGARVVPLPKQSERQ